MKDLFNKANQYDWTLEKVRHHIDDSDKNDLKKSENDFFTACNKSGYNPDNVLKAFRCYRRSNKNYLTSYMEWVTDDIVIRLIEWSEND